MYLFHYFIIFLNCNFFIYIQNFLSFFLQIDFKYLFDLPTIFSIYGRFVEFYLQFKKKPN